MFAKPISPQPLPAEVGRPLLQAAEVVAGLKPWEFLSDLEFIGLRDEASNDLQVASVLGTLGTMFAVVIYRHDAGLRWIHQIAMTRTPPDRYAGLEDMDCLKIEWTKKGELQKPDLETLTAAGFKPKGKGSVWPRFESCQPGWHPWFVNQAEAALLTEHLRKVARFVRLRERVAALHEEPLGVEVPVVPAGDETSLCADDLDWVPLVPRPAPMPEPVVLSDQEEAKLARLPARKERVFELVAPLVPECSFLDGTAGRPCIARVGMIVDRQSCFVVATNIAHGAAPLREAVGPALVRGLHAAKARPGALHVDNETLAAVLRPACQAIGVPLSLDHELNAAYDALDSLEQHFAR